MCGRLNHYLWYCCCCGTIVVYIAMKHSNCMQPCKFIWSLLRVNILDDVQIIFEELSLFLNWTRTCGFPLEVRCHFSFSCFQGFGPQFSEGELWRVLALISVGVSSLGFAQLLESIGFCLLPNLASFRPSYFFEYFLTLALFLLSFRACSDTDVGVLLQSHRSPRLCSFVFSVVQAGWFLFFSLAVHSSLPLSLHCAVERIHWLCISFIVFFL